LWLALLSLTTLYESSTTLAVKHLIKSAMHEVDRSALAMIDLLVFFIYTRLQAIFKFTFV